ncbi:MAG: glycoside hydrolase [Acidobacteria bacterium]|nr:glycoside hydrolase [Acidobacteriota bacterium]
MKSYSPQRLLPVFFLCLISLSAYAQVPPSLENLQQGFQKPPDDSRIMMRWWWFGPSATQEEIAAELRHMKEGGIGGVELQSTYPMALDDPARDFHNYRYLSPEFLDRVGYASRTARELGLRMDLTLGSGWPYGGPYITPKLAAMHLRAETREITPGRTSVARPSPYENETLLAAFVARGSLGETDPASFREIDLTGGGPLTIPQDDGPRTLLFFYSAPTGQAVKRAAWGAEGNVLDHYNQAAIETHLREAGDKLLGAAEPGSIYAVFCDSLEVYGSNWTGDLLSEFQKRRGYDLKPLLPLLEFGDSAQATRVRRDYGRTLSELFQDRFVVPMHAWAKKNHVLLRMQDYGVPPATLSSYRDVDLFEGEGFPWRNLTSTRWASSAAHLFGKSVVSSETWTWIHSPAFRATPLDLKAEADLHFLMGINQLVGHGWPYSPPQAGDPGWTFYAAGAFNQKNPWWPVMPDLSLYLQRMSYLLRQGQPVADVALYVPTEDAYATLKPVSSNQLDLFERAGELIGPNTIPTVLDAGFSFDLFDDGTLPQAEQRHYKTVVLSHVHFVPAATKKWLEQYSRNGGVLLAVGERPEGDWLALKVVQDTELSRELVRAAQPDVALLPATPEIGFTHRQVPGGDIYFLVNTGNAPRQVHAQFRSQRPYAELWDPMTGRSEPLPLQNGKIPLRFAPYASHVVVFRSAGAASAPAPSDARAIWQDLSTGWTVSVGDNAAPKTVSLPYSWTSDSATRYFSGTAFFSRTLSFREDSPKRRIFLDFGEAVPTNREALASGTLRGYSFAALLTPPIREAATVFVNGQRAGAVWAPPYKVELTGLLKNGENTIRVEVYNTAINALAEGGRIPNTQALTEQYGFRFRLQDFENLQPLPSGILSSVKLVKE